MEKAHDGEGCILFTQDYRRAGVGWIGHGASVAGCLEQSKNSFRHLALGDNNLPLDQTANGH